jgi:ferredoxin
MFRTGRQSASRTREQPQETIAVRYELCFACGACVAVCPTDALFLADTHLEVKDACTGCGRCAKICPVQALSLVERTTP